MNSEDAPTTAPLDPLVGQMTEREQYEYLCEGGWLQNDRGWWHPPNCVASWPLRKAIKMAKRDEERGLRMSTGDVMRYLSDVI